MNQLYLPQGYRYSGVSCGIKKAAGKRDVTLIVSELPATAAGVYTQNQVCAAPVRWCRRITPSDNVRAVVVNSGNANACTGEQGERDAASMAQVAGEVLGAPALCMLVMSTGVIGVPLPFERVEQGIRAAAASLSPSESAYLNAVDGIMTTDNGRKIASREVSLSGKTTRIAGMAKGAGMIGPNMATMLGIVVTDARLTISDAQSLLVRVADRSFNAISVEGHTSTNDSLVLLANGAAVSQPLAGNDLAIFESVLTEMSIELARKIPADGEGATHVIEIRVEGAPDDHGARRIAKAIADSALVKTAMLGGDPNWGRIVSAAGYSGVPLDLHRLDLQINGFLLFQRGQPITFNAKEVSQSIRAARDVMLLLRVGDGSGSTTFWTSDLTVDYVRFNAEYTT